MSAILTDADMVVHTGLVEELYKTFGRQLRNLRREAGLSQEELGRRVGLKRTSITNIEAGRQHVALDHLYRLAAAVGRNPSELLPDMSGVSREDVIKDLRLEILGEKGARWVTSVFTSIEAPLADGHS